MAVTQKRTGVLIVGGGVSGLTLAYRLFALGLECLLVEREERLGGLIRTVERDGFILDGGPDAFLTQKPHALALCEELGLSADVIPTNPDQRDVFVLGRGRLHPLPAGMRLTVPTRAWPLVTSSLFSIGGKVRMAAERFVPARRGVEEESIETFVTRRFGREALERLAEPLMAGIHCGDPARLSVDELFPRLVELERRHGSLTRAFTRPGSEGSSSATVFASLKRGLGTMVEALASRLPEGTIWTGRAVTAIERAETGFRSRVEGAEIHSSVLVLALPLRVAEKLVQGLAPRVADRLSEIATVSSAVVFHAFERDGVSHPMNGYGFIVPRSEPSRLLAGAFVSTKFPNRAPESQALIRTFLGGTREPDVLSLADDEIVALSLRELESVLGSLGIPVFSEVVRWPERTPQVELGHRDKLVRIDAALSEQPGLFLLASGLAGVGIPDCIREARALASRISGFFED